MDESTNEKTEEIQGESLERPTMLSGSPRQCAILRPIRDDLSFRMHIDPSGHYDVGDFSHDFMIKNVETNLPGMDKVVSLHLSEPTEYDICFMTVKFLLDDYCKTENAIQMMRWFRNLRVGYGFGKSTKFGEATPLSSWTPFILHFLSGSEPDAILRNAKHYTNDAPKELAIKFIECLIENNRNVYEAKTEVIKEIIKAEIEADNLFATNTYVVKNMTSHQRLARHVLSNESFMTYYKSPTWPIQKAEIEVAFRGILYAGL